MKKVGILLLTGTLLLCSCGQAKETAESSADVPETIQTNLTAQKRRISPLDIPLKIRQTMTLF